MISFTPFPNLETEKLILRRMDQNDVSDIFEMRKDPRMHEYTDTKVDESTEETKAYINKMNKGINDDKWIIWAIEHTQTNKVIGTISIWNFDSEQKSGELGYGIIPDYQGKGLMKEALISVVKYGFGKINLNLLDAYTEENNLSSIKLLEKCDFTEIKRFDDEGYFNNRIYHMVAYRLENNNKH